MRALQKLHFQATLYSTPNYRWILLHRVDDQLSIGQLIFLACKQHQPNVRLIEIRAAVVVSALICTPPCREKMCCSSSPLDRKREKEYHDLRSTIKGCADQIVVFHEPTRVPSTEPPLRQERDREICRNRGVYSNTKPSDVRTDDRCVIVIRAQSRPVTVNNPERKRRNQANEVGQGNPLIPLTI